MDTADSSSDIGKGGIGANNLIATFLNDKNYKSKIPNILIELIKKRIIKLWKLSHLSQIRIPLYIINISKLIFYHPPLASVEFFEFSSIFSDLQKQQVLQNMVGFYNLPSSILDSDDRLMELEKKALRRYHPIHFEINAKVLIATFSSIISDT